MQVIVRVNPRPNKWTFQREPYPADLSHHTPGICKRPLQGPQLLAKYTGTNQNFHVTHFVILPVISSVRIKTTLLQQHPLRYNQTLTAFTVVQVSRRLHARHREHAAYYLPSTRPERRTNPPLSLRFVSSIQTRHQSHHCLAHESWHPQIQRSPEDLHQRPTRPGRSGTEKGCRHARHHRFPVPPSHSRSHPTQQLL